VLACNDDLYGGGNRPVAGRSGLHHDLEADETVLVVVDGMPAARARVRLAIYADGAECGAVDLGEQLGEAVAAGSNVGAPTVLTASCAGAARTRLFTFAAPEDGAYLFDTFGSSFDTALFARAGACGPEEVGCNDDTDGLQSQVRLELVAGQVVTLGVGGFWGNTGDFVLNIRQEAQAGDPPPADPPPADPEGEADAGAP